MCGCECDVMCGYHVQQENELLQEYCESVTTVQLAKWAEELTSPKQEAQSFRKGS